MRTVRRQSRAVYPTTPVISSQAARRKRRDRWGQRYTGATDRRSSGRALLLVTRDVAGEMVFGKPEAASELFLEFSANFLRLEKQRSFDLLTAFIAMETK
jgi:hypothetical protein